MSALEAHATLVTLIFSGIVALSTVAYALLTWALVRETKRLRRVETEPAIGIYVTPSARSLFALELVIANYSRAAALDLKCRVQPPLSELHNNAIRIGSLALLEGLSYLAPGQEIRSFFGSSFEMLKHGTPPVVSVDVQFKDVAGGLHASSFILDVGQLMGLSKVGTPPEVEVAQALEKLSDAISGIVHAGRLHVVCVSEEPTEVREVGQDITPGETTDQKRG